MTTEKFITETPSPSQLIDLKIAVIDFLNRIKSPEISDFDQEVEGLWRTVWSSCKTLNHSTTRGLTEEQLFKIAFNYDCGTSGENQEWLLVGRDELMMFVKDIINETSKGVIDDI